MKNSFGNLFKFSSFGESHGIAVGVLIDSYPAGVYIDIEYIQSEISRRKPGLNRYTTSRKESDNIEILSGVFNGYSTGHPICVITKNDDIDSSAYDNLKDVYRPSHTDYTYEKKYGIRDYRGGGRSSARETLARVIAGSFAKLILNEVGISIFSGIYSIGNIKCFDLNYEASQDSEIYSLDKLVEQKQKDLIEKLRTDGDSTGGVVSIKVKNMPIGIGEPVYNKLDSTLANALISINAVKGVDFGLGFNSSIKRGSDYNSDANNSGGIVGGISNGNDIDIKVSFKPTPSIAKVQRALRNDGKSINLTIGGRHDPCVAIRGSIVCEAMVANVILDLLLLNMSSKVDNIYKIYRNS